MTAERKNSKEALGIRLADMLTRLNNGECLDVQELAEHYGITVRSAQRDINRLSPLLTPTGKRFYRLDQSQYGHLSKNEIERFCRFVSIQNLFPEKERDFYLRHLQESITVKGFQYEDISDKKPAFDSLRHAIAEHLPVAFRYTKAGGEQKHYRIEPYQLINKNGIWYLIGLMQGRQKTFCFTQIDQLNLLPETFQPDSAFSDAVKNTDSISHGNQLKEIVIQVSPAVAPYFQRRKLLPNQTQICQLDNGGLLLACREVNEMEVLPIVQYWIPHLHIISPGYLQDKIIGRLKDYLNL